MIKLPAGRFCNWDCAVLYAQTKSKADRERQNKKAIANATKAHNARKRAVKKRTGKNGYYENLKTELHKYVKHVLRKGEPCYTCGRAQRPTDSPQAFHVGHFISAKSVDPRRFMLENLRIQCYSCNVPNSGMRMEYRARLIKEKGIDHVKWLECDINHKSLKEQYPDVEDIRAETAKYRKLNKAAL